MTDGMNRRRFLKVLGVTGGGAAALGACGIGPEPTQKLIPYLVPTDDQIPGVATYYSTTCRECGAGCGLHVKIREGRAVKIEGNPDSPINHGRLCSRGQAALQGLYNPDRVTAPLVRNAQGRLEETTWDKAIPLLAEKAAAAKGKGSAFVTDHETGSFVELVDEWLKTLGGRRVAYEAFAFEALREGNRLAFGSAAVPTSDFAAAKYVMSFGADFMETWLSPVGFQNGFSDAHAFQAGRDAAMAPYVYVGPRMSLTALSADQWLSVPPGTEGLLALAMAQVIVSRRLAPVPADAARLAELFGRHTLEAVAPVLGIAPQMIARHAAGFAGSGAPLAVAGGMAAHYPNGAEIVAAVNILNYVSGAVGKTVKFGPDLSADAGSFRDVAALQSDMAAGKVALLLVHGANPVHTLGGGFAQAWSKVATKVSFASYLDETASGADLVLPDLHPLEQWNDSQPRAGVYALQQPVMQPVFPNTMAAGDVLLRAGGKSGSYKDYLQTKWRELHRRIGGAKPFDQWWAEALQHGGVYGTAPAHGARLGPDAAKISAGKPAAPGLDGTAGDATVIVFPHTALHDGRGANKPWLQELPDPVAKITWHGWVEVHPETAAKWSLASGDFLRITTAAGAIAAPAWITPSVRPGVLAVPTGQGHTAYGRYAAGRSFNAFDLLSGTPNAYGGRTFAARAGVTKTGEHRRLATVEGNGREQGEGVVNVLPLARATE